MVNRYIILFLSFPILFIMGALGKKKSAKKSTKLSRIGKDKKSAKRITPTRNTRKQAAAIIRSLNEAEKIHSGEIKATSFDEFLSTF